MEPRDAVAVVTGGGSGIGRALALTLAREGADLVLADIDLDAAERVAAEVRELGRQALALHCNVAREEQVDGLVQRTLAEFGRIDCFVSNAGVVLGGPVEEVTDADWTWIMDINFYAHVYAIRHVLPHMLERDRGHLVHIASAAGLIQTGTNIPYHVSKHAVVALAGGLRIDLEARGAHVGVSVVCPETVATNLADRTFSAGQIGANLNEEDQRATGEGAEAMRLRLAQRGLDPEEAARAILEGLREDRYLIYTHPRTHGIVAHRAENPEQGVRDAVGVLLREQERMRTNEARVRDGG